MPPVHEASSSSRPRPTSHVSSALETIDVPSRSNSPPERVPAMSALAASSSAADSMRDPAVREREV
eukprot:4724340-Karenia_brevis.AAC.1